MTYPAGLKERLGEVVTREMWCHEVEDGCVKHFKITLAEAIGLVDDAIREGRLRSEFGKVWLANSGT